MNTNNNTNCNSWKIVENDFCTSKVEASESLFSLGNGVMGQRANFEEHYSGTTLQGNYIGGIYYPDKTRVGWWKNGYPEYFAKVVNSAFWIGIDIKVDGKQVDIAKCEVLDFHRELDMRCSTLTRRMVVRLESGCEIEINSLRFISLTKIELGVIRYSVKVLNRDADVEFAPYIDGDVTNSDSNYDEKFWEFIDMNDNSIQMRTKKSGFEVAWSQVCVMEGANWINNPKEMMIRKQVKANLKCGDEITLYKYVGICSSLNHSPDALIPKSYGVAYDASLSGFESLLAEHKAAWAKKWHSCDIEIGGDDLSQQGIRFCIFMLLQTYTGVDTRLNIGPKGFTGEKYGGVTYWDTEAYCLQFYLSTTGEDVARELLIYRHNQLDKAIENGEKLGFKNGAALYPMVTINGEECHNEWEITFEEIHRNGAIAYAIYNYIRYTGEREYLSKHGLDVLMGIARFWAQRATYSEERKKYVILGVTGPNEYENNVNNNWYTNYIATWCLRYAAEAVDYVRESAPEEFKKLTQKRNFNASAELELWSQIADNMYFPYNDQLDVYMQQDGYMDKEQIVVADLPASERPINQKWSWDRILRSCFIKQADVLQGMYFFQDDFDIDAITRNFEFYEPRTVHESSLSPCVHSILACKIGKMDKAYQMYLRTSRLDLDDYNSENHEGLHITSMAGSWLSMVEGFGGMKVREGVIHFDPQLPAAWTHITFKVNFRGRVISVRATHNEVVVTNEGEAVDVIISGNKYNLVDIITINK